MIKLRKSLCGNENSIKTIAQELSVSERFAKLLAMRGIDTVESAKIFLNPSLDNLSEPTRMNGIEKAVERIGLARESDETVVVYGDYDADGISAATILTRALRIFGVNVHAVVPERVDGYGLSEQMIEKVVEEYCPDLLITVDCGISSVNEVEYLNDLGVDVIVTDHHELQETLPNCTVVNCKIDDGQTFKWLCGAGVAYKLAYALIGDKANNFLDLVAVATLADSMPVTGENRILISEGIKRILQGKCCRAIKELISLSQAKEITSTSLAYLLAPRINAAGRMGDAAAALNLFLSDDEGEIKELAEKLNSYNVLRQSECDALYKDAKLKLTQKSPLLKVIILADKTWKSGLVGIVAARLAEETGKPTILFTEKDGLWHGSARSVVAVNIFDALKSVSEFVENFGGHTQAAGVTVRSENFEKFETALDEYISGHCDLKAFLAPIEVDEIIDKEVDLNYVRELEKLEPCGTDNPKPSFAVYVGNAFASPIKFGSAHLAFKTPFIDLLYFNGYDKIKFLNCNIKKAIIFEPSASTFNGKTTVKGYVRNISCITDDNICIDETVFSSQLEGVALSSKFIAINNKKAQELIFEAQSRIYGTIFVISDVANYSKFAGLDMFDKSVLYPFGKGNVVCVCFGLKGELSPEYKRVVYLDKPFGISAKFAEGTEIYVNCELKGFNADNVSADRSVLGKIYLFLKNSGRSFSDVDEFSEYLGGEFCLKQIRFALKVFYELGLVKTENGKFTAIQGKKCDLSQSEIYRRFSGVI